MQLLQLVVYSVIAMIVLLAAYSMSRLTSNQSQFLQTSADATAELQQVYAQAKKDISYRIMTSSATIPCPLDAPGGCAITGNPGSTLPQSTAFSSSGAPGCASLSSTNCTDLQIFQRNSDQTIAEVLYQTVCNTVSSSVYQAATSGSSYIAPNLTCAINTLPQLVVTRWQDYTQDTTKTVITYPKAATAMAICFKLVLDCGASGTPLSAVNLDGGSLYNSAASTYSATRLQLSALIEGASTLELSNFVAPASGGH